MSRRLLQEMTTACFSRTTAVCGPWGQHYGQLGDGNYSNTNQPEQIVAAPLPALGITTVGSLPVMVWPALVTNCVLQNDLYLSVRQLGDGHQWHSLLAVCR